MDRFASGAWVDRSTVRVVSAATLAATLGLIALTLLTRNGTLDAWGRPIGTDFTLLWSAGRMTLSGGATEVYDWARHFAAQRAAHGGADIGFAGWHYPPPFLLVAAPLATMPYLLSLLVWQAATLGACLAVVSRVLPGRDALLASLAFPAALVCLGHGHNGFLTAALFAGGLLVIDRRPLLGGALLGCLIYKPQFGLLIPFALVAGGHWRAIGGAVASACILSLLTLALFGPDPWLAFRDSLDLTRRVVVEDGATGWFKIVSAFSAVRLWGGSVAGAYAVQGIVTGLVLAATAWLWRAGAALPLRAAALLAGSLLATPYVLDYDMMIIGPAIAWLAARGIRRGFLPWEKTILALAWFAPLAARHFALHAGVPAGFLATALLFGVAVRRAWVEAGGIGALQPSFRGAEGEPGTHRR